MANSYVANATARLAAVDHIEASSYGVETESYTSKIRKSPYITKMRRLHRHYLAGYNAATAMGESWDQGFVHDCPHDPALHNTRAAYEAWHEGYRDGKDDLDSWPDFIAAIEWVPITHTEGNHAVIDAESEAEDLH